MPRNTSYADVELERLTTVSVYSQWNHNNNSDDVTYSGNNLGVIATTPR